MKTLPLLFVAALAATPAIAEDASFAIGGDIYEAGSSVRVTEPARSVFAAGENVIIAGDVAQNVHSLGRNLSIDGRIDGSLYGAGQTVSVEAAVGADASLMGETVVVTAPVAGNLRVAGEDVTIEAPVAGSALIGGMDVTIDGQINGDVALGAENITWGDSAVILGALTLYTDNADLTVPERVIASDLVTIETMKDWERDYGHYYDHGSGFGDYIWGVVIVGGLAFLLAQFAPQWTERQRARALSTPWKSGLAGFLGISALVGAVLGLALTGLGIVASPFALIAAFLLAGVGYFFAAYTFGVWLVQKAGRGTPERGLDKAIAGFGGAAMLGLLAVIPLLGWWAVLAAAWLGAGAMVLNWIEPRLA